MQPTFTSRKRAHVRSRAIPSRMQLTVVGRTKRCSPPVRQKMTASAMRAIQAHTGEKAPRKVELPAPEPPSGDVPLEVATAGVTPLEAVPGGLMLEPRATQQRSWR